MSDIIKNGKKPVTSKKKPQITQFSADDLRGNNPYKLDPELQKELEDQNLAWRFVNATKVKEMGGRHKNDWVVYKRKTTPGLTEFSFGQDPDGYVRYGDSILAVLPKEKAEYKRAINQFKADNLAKSNKQKAEELKKQARNAGVNMSVLEGYEDNE